jgi:hypothetical protein
MKKVDIAKLLSYIASAYPRFPVITETMVDIWHEFFETVDYETAQKAAKNIIIKNSFPPSIADMYQEIKDIDNRSKVEIFR